MTTSTPKPPRVPKLLQGLPNMQHGATWCLKPPSPPDTTELVTATTIKKQSCRKQATKQTPSASSVVGSFNGTGADSAIPNPAQDAQEPTAPLPRPSRTMRGDDLLSEEQAFNVFLVPGAAGGGGSSQNYNGHMPMETEYFALARERGTATQQGHESLMTADGAVQGAPISPIATCGAPSAGWNAANAKGNPEDPFGSWENYFRALSRAQKRPRDCDQA